MFLQLNNFWYVLVEQHQKFMFQTLHILSDGKPFWHMNRPNIEKMSTKTLNVQYKGQWLMYVSEWMQTTQFVIIVIQYIRNLLSLIANHAKISLTLTYIKYPRETLSSETTEGIFVPWRLDDFEHHFALNQFRRQGVVT